MILVIDIRTTIRPFLVFRVRFFLFSLRLCASAVINSSYGIREKMIKPLKAHRRREKRKNSAPFSCYFVLLSDHFLFFVHISHHPLIYRSPPWERRSEVAALYSTPLKSRPGERRSQGVSTHFHARENSVAVFRAEPFVVITLPLVGTVHLIPQQKDTPH